MSFITKPYAAVARRLFLKMDKQSRQKEIKGDWVKLKTIKTKDSHQKPG
jgi:hypothetical protein